MRVYLYLLSGVTSALIGWNIAQVFLADWGILTQAPEIVLFPCIAISLGIGMVMNEIFISNPTRVKLNLRRAQMPLLITAILGLLSGLAAGGISVVLFLPQIGISAPIVRTLGWLLIGLSVGLSEGLSWQFYSQEAGDRTRYLQRLMTSLIGSVVASLAAALLFELLLRATQQLSTTWRNLEDPIGFSILGLLLGLTLSLTSSPSYQAALRAGKGFEYISYLQDSPTYIPPMIQGKNLKFVSESDESKKIEEGLSIQLPSEGKIFIGSEPEDHIYIPQLPPRMAELEIKAREVTFKPHSLHYNKIEYRGKRLTSPHKFPLKHNDLITFYAQDQDNQNEPAVYRFVYYNRFLDPQS